MIRVGSTVRADFMDVGMSHRQRYTGLAVVTAVHPTPKVKPLGWSFDRTVAWSEIRELTPDESAALPRKEHS